MAEFNKVEAIKAEIEKEAKICFGCGIDCSELYYECIYHKKIICESCVKNDNAKMITFAQTIRCRKDGEMMIFNPKMDECIYKKHGNTV